MLCFAPVIEPGWSTPVNNFVQLVVSVTRHVRIHQVLYCGARILECIKAKPGALAITLLATKSRPMVNGYIRMLVLCSGIQPCAGRPPSSLISSFG